MANRVHAEWLSQQFVPGMAFRMLISKVKWVLFPSWDVADFGSMARYSTLAKTLAVTAASWRELY